METVQFIILAGLSGISIALSIVVLIKLKAVHYLLELPVVKKMSPALKLKPIKVDEAENNHKHDSRPSASHSPSASPSHANANRGPRPNFERAEGGERQNRDHHPRNERNDRGPRPEGNGDRAHADRSPSGDRGQRNDRTERNERNPRDQNRGQRNAPQGGEGRHGGQDRGPDRFDRNRNRNEGHSNTSEATSVDGAMATGRPSASEVAETNSAPVLAPRRPLPSTLSQEVSAKDLAPAEPIAAEVAADAMFMRDDSEMQHGRRTQMKKKPKFDVSEEEIQAASAEEAKV